MKPPNPITRIISASSRAHSCASRLGGASGRTAKMGASTGVGASVELRPTFMRARRGTAGCDMNRTESSPRWPKFFDRACNKKGWASITSPYRDKGKTKSFLKVPVEGGAHVYQPALPFTSTAVASSRFLRAKLDSLPPSTPTPSFSHKICATVRWEPGTRSVPPSPGERSLKRKIGKRPISGLSGW